MCLSSTSCAPRGRAFVRCGARIYEWHPVAPLSAKCAVKNPVGVNRRSETVPVSCVAIAMLVGVEPTAWPAPRLSPNVTKASGLVSQPPGSAGNCSRQATTKLLACPLARAAQGWLSSDVACSGWGWDDGKHGTWRRRGPHKFFLEGAGRFGGASRRVDLCED